MSRIRIKNVGPIKSGLCDNEGFIDFSGITVFIGSQGSGKSTIAKLMSTLSWIEKALVRGDFTSGYLTQYNRFKKQLAYQNISNYLNDASEIEYHGKAYDLLYKNGRLEITKNQGAGDYVFPKIMYIPAERNFVSSVDKPDLIKRLPLPLYTFLDEYEDAKQSITEAITLPINDLKFDYKKQNKKSLLIGEDFKIELLEASSGFQSAVPLILVTRYLTDLITNRSESGISNISIVEEKKIKKEIDTIFKNKNISEDVRRVMLETLSARFQYACFINVVEEPEQNLYPSSQRKVLYELITSKNKIESNKLILTTHSPYIINYLTLAIKAHDVKEKIIQSDCNQSLLELLYSNVPKGALVNANDIKIYELSSEGTINTLDTYNGLPVDENHLNEFLAEFNEDFIRLLEIEDKCQ